MFAEYDLELQLDRLRSTDEWTPKGQGLSFLFPREGVGKCVSGPVTEHLSTGDVVILNRGHAGRVCPLNGGELVFSSFSLCLEHLLPLFEAKEISLLKQVEENLKGIKVYPAATLLAAKCHRLISEIPPGFNLDHRSQLVRVAAAVLTEEFKTAEGKRVGFVRVEDRIIRVFDELSTKELLTLSVGGLADRFACCRRHLNRLFQRHFGFSVSGLKMELRLRQAVSLLRDPDIKIINLAEQCGFNHLGFFTTCFKRRFGTSPGRWRKNAAQFEGSPPGRLHANSDCFFGSTDLGPSNGNSVKTSRSNAEPYRTRKAVPSRLLIAIGALNPLESELWSVGGRSPDNLPAGALNRGR